MRSSERIFFVMYGRGVPRDQPHGFAVGSATMYGRGVPRDLPHGLAA